MKQHTPFIILLLLSGCAGSRPPEGGPVDSTPPEIISVSPAPNTVNFTDNKVVFEFNEYVDRRSAEEAVFISPNIGDVEFDWSGTEVEILFNEELRKNTTYVITIGTDVNDVRARNKMANAFSLAFSTGEKIDNGVIAGNVYDEGPDKSGVMIFSYRLNALQPDTLDPTYTQPDYITQTGNDGSFHLTNVAPGTYRLFAIRDEYRNLLYDPETDAAGTADDAIVTEKDTLVSGLQFVLAKEDTTPPRIASVNAADKHHVVVLFSEEIDSSTIASRRFSISDTLRQETLNVAEVFPNGIWSSFTLVTDSQKSGEMYLLSVDSLKDNAGFLINTIAREKQFNSSAVKDTLAPALVFSTARDSTSKILADQPLVFSFSDALLKPIADSTVRIKSTKESATVPFAFSWLSPASFALQPLHKLTIGTVYSVSLDWNDIKDLLGNYYKDSVSTFKFSVLDPDEFGSIDGSFTGFDNDTQIVIQAKNINNKNQRPFAARMGKTGKFSLTLLPEGNYVLKAFKDRNNNFIHDAGRVFPYLRSEKFSLYSDTIRVRARWPVDGVLFKGK